MLSKLSQTEKAKYSMVSLNMWNLREEKKNHTYQKTEQKDTFQGLQSGENRGW